MSKRRKTVTMTLTVSAPVGMTVTQVRQEVRSRIDHLAGHWAAYELDLPDSDENAHGYLCVKVRKLGPAR